MPQPDDDALARELTAAIRSIDGVGTIFRTSPLLDAATQTVASTLNLPEPQMTLQVETSADGTAVTVHLSTTTLCPSPGTLRTVAAVLRDRIAAAHPGPVAITIKVLQIERAPA